MNSPAPLGGIVMLSIPLDQDACTIDAMQSATRAKEGA